MISFASVVAFLISAAAGQPQLQVYPQSGLRDAPYQKHVFEKVAKSFQVPRSMPDIGKKAVVQAIVDRQGQLLSTSVSYSSQHKAWDAAALRAVKKAAPFMKLPPSFQGTTLEIHFHFSVER